MKRLMVQPDPIAAVLGAALLTCGVFGVAAKLGITADELAEVLGALAAAAASIRGAIIHRRNGAPGIPSPIDASGTSKLT